MTDLKAAFEATDWAMSRSDFNAMVARASNENSPSALSTRVINNSSYVIDIHGPIVKTHSFMSLIMGAVSADDIIAAINDGQEHSEIILDIDSPGGEVRAGRGPVEAIRASSVPVRTYASGACASLAYLFASNTDSIEASPDALVGSVGVMGYHDEDEGVVRSQNAPDKNSREDAQQRANAMETQLIADIATGRNITPQQVIDGYGKGMAFVASHALDRGMIDSISAAPSAITPKETPIVSDKKDGVTFSAEDIEAAKVQAAEQAKAELLAEQKQERERAEAEAAKKEAAELKRKNAIEASPFAAARPKMVASFFEGPLADVTAEQAVAMLGIAPEENEKTSFDQAKADPENNPDVDAGSQASDKEGEAEKASVEDPIIFKALEIAAVQGIEYDKAYTIAKEQLSALLAQ